MDYPQAGTLGARREQGGAGGDIRASGWVDVRVRYSRVLLDGSHCWDMACSVSSLASSARWHRYWRTLRAICASSYSFLALRKELRRTRFLCAPVGTTSNTAALALPWLSDLKGAAESREGG